MLTSHLVLGLQMFSFAEAFLHQDEIFPNIMYTFTHSLLLFLFTFNCVSHKTIHYLF
jgi:hypothetical protein